MTLILKYGRDVVGYADNEAEALTMIAEKTNSFETINLRYKGNIRAWYNDIYANNVQRAYAIKEIKKGIID